MQESEKIRLLIAEDEPKLRSILSRELAQRGFQVTMAEDGTQAVSVLEKQEFDVLLLDVRMPGKDGLEVLAVAREIEPAPEAVMLTGNSTVETAVEAMKRGACDFVTKPCPLDALEQILRSAAERRVLRRSNDAMKRKLADERNSGFLYESPVMAEVETMIRRLAPSDGTVLVLGESGTGKEVAALAIHSASERREAPFVDINCGAIPESLLESELFGHEKGAFTGADAARPGLFEMAHRGTLFLDEIGEIPIGLQVKLLRVLETKTFYRVGGRRRCDADVRVIAATNRDLQQEIEEGRFRNDLYYRINALQLELPPLRDRREDIPLLAKHFAAPKPIADDALGLLSKHDWPGNVRELKHVIERALLIGGEPDIVAADLPAEVLAAPVPPGITVSGGAASAAASVAPPAPVATRGLKEIEREQILAVLEQVRWHRGKAAEILGVSPKTLYRKLRSYRISN
jgi:two-component system response regulator AtoC